MRLARVFTSITGRKRVQEEDEEFLKQTVNNSVLFSQFVSGLQNGRSNLNVAQAHSNRDSFFRIHDRDTDKKETTLNYHILSNARNLLFIGSHITDRTGSRNDSVKMVLNGSGTYNYEYEGSSGASQNGGQNTLSYTVSSVASTGDCTSGAASGMFGFFIGVKGETHKSFVAVFGKPEYTSETKLYIATFAAHRSSTQKIDDISLAPLTGPNFVAGNRVSIYGLG